MWKMCSVNNKRQPENEYTLFRLPLFRNIVSQNKNSISRVWLCHAPSSIAKRCVAKLHALLAIKGSLKTLFAMWF